MQLIEGGSKLLTRALTLIVDVDEVIQDSARQITSSEIVEGRVI